MLEKKLSENNYLYCIEFSKNMKLSHGGSEEYAKFHEILYLDKFILRYYQLLVKITQQVSLWLYFFWNFFNMLIQFVMDEIAQKFIYKVYNIRNYNGEMGVHIAL